MYCASGKCNVIKFPPLIISAMKVTALPKNKVLKGFCFFLWKLSFYTNFPAAESSNRFLVYSLGTMFLTYVSGNNRSSWREENKYDSKWCDIFLLSHSVADSHWETRTSDTHLTQTAANAGWRHTKITAYSLKACQPFRSLTEVINHLSTRGIYAQLTLAGMLYHF